MASTGTFISHSCTLTAASALARDVQAAQKAALVQLISQIDLKIIMHVCSWGQIFEAHPWKNLVRKSVSKVPKSSHRVDRGGWHHLKSWKVQGQDHVHWNVCYRSPGSRMALTFIGRWECVSIVDFQSRELLKHILTATIPLLNAIFNSTAGCARFQSLEPSAMTINFSRGMYSVETWGQTRWLHSKINRGSASNSFVRCWLYNS